MDRNLIRQWKKVFLSDLSYISYELKEVIKAKSVILLEGAMGVGKTTLAKNFIGEDKQTESPSYSLVYEVGHFLHADFYRVKDKEEIFQLELALYLENKSYFLIEWGLDYLHTIFREIPEDFTFYELKIAMSDQVEHEKVDAQSISRNFHLYELEDI